MKRFPIAVLIFLCSSGSRVSALDITSPEQVSLPKDLNNTAGETLNCFINLSFLDKIFQDYALQNSKGNLDFQGEGTDFLFSGNQIFASKNTAFLYSSDTLSFSGYNLIDISNNVVTAAGSNTTEITGSALSGKDVTLSGNKVLSLTNNQTYLRKTTTTTGTAASFNGLGGAISANGGSKGITISNNKQVSINNNYAASRGGAFETDKSVRIENNGYVEFLLNSSSTLGGAVHCLEDCHIQNNGSVIFKGNVSSKNAGGLSHRGNLYIKNNGNVIFSDNMSTTNGGAIIPYNKETDTTTTTRKSVVIQGNKSVLFNNNISSFGGAIWVDTLYDLHLIADAGNITFQYNYEVTPSNFIPSQPTGIRFRHLAAPTTGTATTVAGDGVLATASATEGHFIYFYDQLFWGDQSDTTSTSLPTLIINGPAENDTTPHPAYTGTVIFSSNHLLEPFASNTNRASAYATKTIQAVKLQNGTLHIDSDTGFSSLSFKQEGGKLLLGAKSIFGLRAHTTHAERTITLTNVALDMSSFSIFSDPSTTAAIIDSNGGTLTISGALNLENSDAFLSRPSYVLNQELNYSLLKLNTSASPIRAGTTLAGTATLANTLSTPTELKIAPSYGYQGNATLTWSEDKSQLSMAVTPTEYIVDPRKLSSLTNNLLWAHSGALQHLHQASHVQTSPYHQLGGGASFFSWKLNNDDDKENMMYRSTGYAINARLLEKESSYLDLCFSQLFSHAKSDSLTTKSKSDIFAFGLKSKVLPFLIREMGLISSSIYYGYAKNQIKTRFDSDNVGLLKNRTHTIFAELGLEEFFSLYSTNENVLLPFFKTSFFFAQQPKSLESGFEPRRYRRATLYDLALPVGLSFSSSSSRGSPRALQASLAVVTDIYRKNPEGSFLLTTNNMEFLTSGENLTRCSLSFDSHFNTTFFSKYHLHLDYHANIRKNLITHSVHAGGRILF